jgi:hypothetical protein
MDERHVGSVSHSVENSVGEDPKEAHCPLGRHLSGGSSVDMVKKESFLHCDGLGHIAAMASRVDVDTDSFPSQRPSQLVDVDIHSPRPATARLKQGTRMNRNKGDATHHLIRIA